MGCVIWAIHVFDWQQIAAAMIQMHWELFVSKGLVLIGCIFAVRGLRWLTVLDMPLNRQRFWQSFYANGVASGLATITPFQLGEVIKIKMVPDHHGSAWRIGVSAFFLERLLDLAGVAGIGGYGLALHFKTTSLAFVSLSAPLWGSVLLHLLSPASRYLPGKLQPYVAIFRHGRRVVAAGILTMLLWLLYAGLWWTAIQAIGVLLDFSQICMLLGGVMLAVVASFSPGGFGIAELSSRGIMIWLGASPANADATAIALRLLTLLLVICGGICFGLLVRYRHRANLRTEP